MKHTYIQPHIKIKDILPTEMLAGDISFLEVRSVSCRFPAVVEHLQLKVYTNVMCHANVICWF